MTNVPRAQSASATNGYFRTGDGGWVMAVCRSESDFRKLAAALDAAEPAAENPFGPRAGDPAEAARLRALIDAAFARFTRPEICDRLTRQDLMHAPLRSLAEAAESDASRDAGCFQEVDDGWGGSFLTTAAPIRFPDGAPATGRGAPKQLLRDAGYPPAAVEGLLQAGAAG